MEAGVQVWSYEGSGDDPWILSEIVHRSPDAITLKHIVGGTAGKTFSRALLPSADDGTSCVGVELANSPLSKAEIAEGVDSDMIALQHLNEPAILHALSERYFRGEIYTWTGPILIAVNPFQRLPLYTKEILESYRQEGILRSKKLLSGQGMAKELYLGPHVFSVADRSYRLMMSEQRKSQSILISGESGAGKTETTKIVLLYLATLGSADTDHEVNKDGRNEKLSIMERVMQSNPLLEAFGNAKTLRNDNSSRFGKFIELAFDRQGVLKGAKVQTYLLEKVRISNHCKGERNYHIFYQVLRGATDRHHKYSVNHHESLNDEFDLANFFHLTGQGGASHSNDEEEWKTTLQSMHSMGWNEEKVDLVLRFVAGILHLGQVTFLSAASKEVHEIAKIADEKVVEDAARLLGVDSEKLVTALTVRILAMSGDEIRIDLTPSKAADARDALASTVYGAMFLWVVNGVNDCIKWESSSDVCSSAGVLDIFGFESFLVNSFEQLCINFTNEALQQQFNKFIFKLEQELYESEGISSSFISFPDNQDCLDTIQARPKGILTMLDDECKLGERGNDKNWLKRLNDTYLPNRNQEVSDNTRYIATKMQQAKGIFCVRHFAGAVEYVCDSFLEKNKDEIPLTAKSLFEQGSSDLVKEIYMAQRGQCENKLATPPEQKSKQRTVSQQFKAQLSTLIEMIEATDPHYIRCLKPNDAGKPNLMTRSRLTEQLRYGGVLEAVRVARVGYPSRLDHAVFFKRYRMLLQVSDEVLPWSIGEEKPHILCAKFLDVLLAEGCKTSNCADTNGSRANKIRMAQQQPKPLTFPKSDVQVGLTKVFMRKGPHDMLESHRIFHQNASITLVQSWIRGMQQTRSYFILRESALLVQRWCRGCFYRYRVRKSRASLLITNNFRMQIKRRKYSQVRSCVVRVQARFRGLAARRVTAFESSLDEKENAFTHNVLQYETSMSSFGKFTADKHVDTFAVACGVTPAAWAQHCSELLRLEEQLELLHFEKETFLKEKEQTTSTAEGEEKVAAASGGRRKLVSRGMRSSVTILLITIVVLMGVMLSSSTMDGIENKVEDYNLRGNSMRNASLSHTPPTPPIIELENRIDETPFCSVDTKRFDITVRLGSDPSQVSWSISDDCTLETYYSCSQCYANSVPNYPAHFAGCLPTSHSSTGERINYLLKIIFLPGSGSDDNSLINGYGLMFDGNEVKANDFETSVFDENSTKTMQLTHHFGDGGGCSESPSISLEPTTPPSRLPSISPTSSGSPTASPIVLECVSIFDPSSPLTRYWELHACGPRGNDADEDTSECPNGATAVCSGNGIVIDGCTYLTFTVFKCNALPGQSTI